MRQTNQEIMRNVDDATCVKRIANNTVKYERSNGDIVYRLHNTDIVVKHADGTFTLNSGGWKTVTTKDRLNTYTPARVYSDKGMWRTRDGITFYDGMKVDANGRTINPPQDDVAERDVKVLRAKIKKFVRLIDDCEELPVPKNGDCWYCLMFNAEKPQDGKYDYNTVAGQSGPDASASDHLMSHMDEGYLHGSLLVNAMRWAGYKDVGISLYYGMGKSGRETFKRTLRRYLNRKFGLV